MEPVEPHPAQTPNLPIKKPPTRMEAILKSVFGQTSPFFQRWKTRTLVTQMKRDDVYDLALNYLGLTKASKQEVRLTLQAVGVDRIEQMVQELLMPLKDQKLDPQEVILKLEELKASLDPTNSDLASVRSTIDKKIQSLRAYIASCLIGSAFEVQGSPNDRYVDGLFQVDETICEEMGRILEGKAKALGFSDDKNASGLRSLSFIKNLWQGSVDDKLQALQLIVDLDQIEQKIQELLEPLKNQQLDQQEAILKLEKLKTSLHAKSSNLTSVIAHIDEKIQGLRVSIASRLIGKAFEVQGVPNDRYVNGLFQGDEAICEEMGRILEDKAKALGYSDDPNISGLRRPSIIKDLWKGSVDDKLLALQLIGNQLSARDIQVGALSKLFSRVPEEDLHAAVAQHYEKYKEQYGKEPFEIRVAIGTSGLTKVFFRNEKGEVEVALAHIDETGEAGTFKRYNIAGTVSAVKDIACLDLHLEKVQEAESLEILRREMKFWNEQNTQKVRHIPALYSYTDKNIFCENYTGGDLLQFTRYLKPAEREDVFRRAGIVLLEYLEDIGKLGLVHRDLKPENMLVSKDGKEIVVTDFGLMARTTEQRDPAGTPGYAAPELYGINPVIDKPSDIFSAAMALAVIRYNVDRDEVEKTMLARNQKNEVDAFDRILFEMLLVKPANRPTADKALSRWREALA